MQRPYLGALMVLATTLMAPVAARAAGSHHQAADPLTTRVAITQNFNVALVNGYGGARRVVTSRGTGYNGLWYPRYAWSFDGKYILLVKNTTARNRGTRADLLLLDRTGIVLRTLATLPPAADFEPAWANDTDQIAYIAWQKFGLDSAPYNGVNAVDVTGHKRFLWGYKSTASGCGGGTVDPAQQLFDAETGFGGIPQSLQWSTSRHIAVYSAACSGGLQVPDLRSQRAHHLGVGGESWDEAALSRSGMLAALVRRCGPTVCTKHVRLINTASGNVIRDLQHAELPSWSPEGRTLYFIRRVGGKRLPLHDSSGTAFSSQTYTSSIWRANADGTHMVQLLTEDAFGFGPLNPTPDGRSLIYSRVDNLWNLYRHRLADGRYTSAMLKLYGPRVQIERFDSGHRPVVMVANAGRPAVSP